MALPKPKTRRRTSGGGGGRVGGPVGVDGRGSSRDIDAVVCQRKVSGENWRAEAWATRPARLYYLQNWRADVVVTTDGNGVVVDHTRHNGCGVARKVSVSVADVASDSLDTAYNPNGGVGAEDLVAFIAAFIAGNVAVADVATDSLDVSRNPNASVGSEDLDAFIPSYAAFSGEVVRKGVLKSGGINSGLGGNRFGYAGYELDPALRAVTGGVITQTMYHVRNRVYDAENGRWTRRDPLGYVDGMGLYEYCGSEPEDYTDEFGLTCSGSNDEQRHLTIYPRFPSEGACSRWAYTFCDSRAGSYNSNCHSECVASATKACSKGGTESQAINAGVVALAMCNTKPSQADKNACYTACMNANNCGWACDECEDGFHILKVIFNCALGAVPLPKPITRPGLLPAEPIGPAVPARSPYNPMMPIKIPFRKILVGCGTGWLYTQTEFCFLCVGCMIRTEEICRGECGLRW